jgi:hypothetical protein
MKLVFSAVLMLTGLALWTRCDERFHEIPCAGVVGKVGQRGPSKMAGERQTGEPQNAVLRTIRFIESEEFELACAELRSSPAVNNYLRVQMVRLSGRMDLNAATVPDREEGEAWMTAHAALLEKILQLGLTPFGTIGDIDRARLAKLDQIDGAVAFMLAVHEDAARSAGDDRERWRTVVAMNGLVWQQDLAAPVSGLGISFDRSSHEHLGLRDVVGFLRRTALYGKNAPAETTVRRWRSLMMVPDAEQIRVDLASALPVEFRRTFPGMDSRAMKRAVGRSEELSLGDLEMGFLPGGAERPGLIPRSVITLEAGAWLMEKTRVAMAAAALDVAVGDLPAVDPVSGQPFRIDLEAGTVRPPENERLDGYFTGPVIIPKIE